MYARGNHTLAEIIEGYNSENEDEIYSGPNETSEVIHTHFRKVPVSKYDDLPFSHWLIDSKPGRGAFEVSVVYLE